MWSGVMKVKQKKWFQFINRLATTFMFIVLILTLFLVVNSKISGGHVNLFGYQIKTVLSGSMEPDIKTGSIIFVKTGGDMQRFNEGDVITFKADENILVTHRITDIENDGQQYITKGDANEGADIDPVLAENVVVQYTGFTIPFVGYVMNFASSQEGAALLLILPGTLLIIYAFITIWQAARVIDRTKKQVNTESDS